MLAALDQGKAAAPVIALDKKHYKLVRAATRPHTAHTPPAFNVACPICVFGFVAGVTRPSGVPRGPVVSAVFCCDGSGRWST